MPRKYEDARLPLDFGECEEDGLDTERISDGSTKKLSTDCSPRDDLARARRVYLEAVTWTMDNPSAWSYMRKSFRELGERGRKFSMQKIFEDARDKGELTFTPRSGGRFSISHDIRSPLVRMLRREYPQYAHLLRLHHTAFDELDELA
jgi:hypothetical protein